MRARTSILLIAGTFLVWISGCVADVPDPPGSANPNGDSDSGANDSGSAQRNGSGGTSENGSGSDVPGATPAGSCADIDGGGEICSGGTPVCCAVQNPAGGYHSISFACSDSNASCAALDAGVAITCRLPSDCPSGSVCCGRVSPSDQAVYVSVKCETTCTGDDALGQVTFCDPNDPHTCDGTNGGTTPTCESDEDFPGMFACAYAQ